jgi:hypothetical protein
MNQWNGMEWIKLIQYQFILLGNIKITTYFRSPPVLVVSPDVRAPVLLCISGKSVTRPPEACPAKIEELGGGDAKRVSVINAL